MLYNAEHYRQHQNHKKQYSQAKLADIKIHWHCLVRQIDTHYRIHGEQQQRNDDQTDICEGRPEGTHNYYEHQVGDF